MSDLDNNDQPVSVDGAIGFDLKYAESESSLSAFTDLHFRIRADGTYVRVWALDPSLLHLPVDEITGTNISGPTMLLLTGLGFIGFAALAFAWRRRH